MLQMQQFDFEFVENKFSDLRKISLKILMLIADNSIEQDAKLLELQNLFENRRNLLEELNKLYNSELWHDIVDSKIEFVNEEFSKIKKFDEEINKNLTIIVNDIGANIKNLVKSSAVLKYNEG